MPRVPEYTGFQANPGTLPQARLSVPNMPDIAGQQAQEMSRGMMQAGGAAGQIALEMQGEFNKVLVDSSRAQLQEGLRALTMEAVQLTGRNAMDRPDGKPLTEEYGEKAKKIFDGIDGTLKNDAQKAMFRQIYAGEAESLQGKLGTHMLNQQKQFKADTREANRDAAYKGAYTFAALPPDREKYRAQALSVADEIINESGLNPTKDQALIDKVRSDVMTPFHASVLKSFLDNSNTADAKAYYDQNSAEMSTQGRVNFADAITKMDAELTTGARVRELVSDDQMTLADAVKVVEKEYGKDPTKLKMARAELNYQFDLKKQVQRDQEEELLSPVNVLLGDALNRGSSIGKAERNAVLSRLRGEAPELYAKAAGAIDQHNDEIRNESRAAASHARSMAESSPDARLNGLAMKYDMLTNPGKYQSADLKATLFPLVREGRLKVNDAEELINMQAKLRDPAKRSDYVTLMTGSQYLDARLDGAVVDGKPFADLSKKRQAEIKTNALMIADPLLRDLQAGGTKATKDDVNRVINSLFTDRNYRNTFLNMTYGGTKTESAFKPEGANVREAVGRVPQAARTAIEKALRSNGIDPTPETIIEYYNARP